MGKRGKKKGRKKEKNININLFVDNKIHHLENKKHNIYEDSKIYEELIKYIHVVDIVHIILKHFNWQNCKGLSNTKCLTMIRINNLNKNLCYRCYLNYKDGGYCKHRKLLDDNCFECMRCTQCTKQRMCDNCHNMYFILKEI